MKRLLFLVCLFAVACGGPKKVIFTVNGQIQKPQEIPEEEFEKISPILSSVPISVYAELKDEKGKLEERKAVKSNINNNTFSARIDFTVEDFSKILSIKSESSKLIVFSKVLFSDKLEKIEDLNYCREGDIDKDGYDWMCKIDFAVTPKVSESIKSYVLIRERLTKAEEEDFCRVYASVNQDINNLDPEIREIALSDARTLYNAFTDKIRKKTSDIFSKIEKERDCSGKDYLNKVKDYFCLPEKIISESKDKIALCDAYAAYDEGVALVKKGRYVKALDKFREAIRIKQDFWEPYVAIGDIYFEEKRYEDAKDMYRQALEYTQNPKIYEKLGETYMKMNLFEAADESFRKAIDLAGEKAWHSLFYKRALALKKLGKWEQASEPAKRAIDTINLLPEIKYDRELQKKLAVYQTLLGEIYFNLQRIEEAKRTLEEAIKIDPFEDEALLLLAQIYSSSENKSDLREAKRYYEKLFTLDSEFAKSGDTWYKYALLLETLEEDERKIAQALENSVKFSPNNDQAYLKLAKIYEKIRGYEKIAEENYKKAYETSKPENKSQNFREYISFLFKQGKYAVAKKIISDYIEKYPDDKEAKRLYNETNLMIYTINPSSLRRFGLAQRSLDEIYTALSSIPDNIISEITETVGISKDFFLRLDPYKRLVVVIAYMDTTYGTSGKGSRLQKSQKYKEWFGNNLSRRTANILSRLTLKRLGIDFK